MTIPNHNPFIPARVVLPRPRPCAGPITILSQIGPHDLDRMQFVDRYPNAPSESPPAPSVEEAKT